MLLTKSGFRVFTEYDLSTTLESQINLAKKEIESDVKTRASGDESEYISKQVEKYKLNPLQFDEAKLTVTTSEQMISSEYFPSSSFIDEGESYLKEVFTFHLPFSGDETLLKCVPSSRLLWTEEVCTENNEILFDVINFSDSAEDIKRKRDEVINFLKKQSENVNNQVREYNENLNKSIKDIIAETTNKLSRQSDILMQLGTPLRINNLENIKDITDVTHLTHKKQKQFDVFICHASEDKEFVRNMAESLRDKGIEVWYDDFQLGWGDDLRPAIDNGLKNSKFGIVVFSKAFLAKKKWTEYELNALFSIEKIDKKVILPVWHDILRDDLAEYSPALADRLALSSNSVNQIVSELEKLIR